jgi:hypothetical protein
MSCARPFASKRRVRTRDGLPVVDARHRWGRCMDPAGAVLPETWGLGDGVEGGGGR